MKILNGHISVNDNVNLVMRWSSLPLPYIVRMSNLTAKLHATIADNHELGDRGASRLAVAPRGVNRT